MAIERGGAIFVLDNNCEEIFYPTQCFLFDIGRERHLITVQMSAQFFYGGLLDRCFSDYKDYLGHNTSGIDNIKNISMYEPILMAITSDPVRICICTNSLIDCSLRTLTCAKMRGEAFHFIGTVVDQDRNPKNPLSEQSLMNQKLD